MASKKSKNKTTALLGNSNVKINSQIKNAGKKVTKAVTKSNKKTSTKKTSKTSNRNSNTTIYLTRSGMEIYNTSINKSIKQPNDINYKLEVGDTTYIRYISELYSDSYEEDYADISSNASISCPIKYLNYFYKGRRVALKKGNSSKNMKWADMATPITGFITDVTYTRDKVDVKIQGMSKLLETEAKFKFKKTKRSKIVKKIIESAGLKAKINVKGLKDEKTDFTNIQTTNSSKSSNTGSIGNSSITEYAQEVCEGCTTDKQKAEAIHKEITHVKYPSPNYLNHKKCPKKVLKDKISNCCDRARTGHEMANAVGLKNRGVHGPGHVWIQYKINGKWVDSDPSSSRKSLGKVWKNLNVNRKWDFPKC